MERMICVRYVDIYVRYHKRMIYGRVGKCGAIRGSGTANLKRGDVGGRRCLRPTHPEMQSSKSPRRSTVGRLSLLISAIPPGETFAILEVRYKLPIYIVI